MKNPKKIWISSSRIYTILLLLIIIGVSACKNSFELVNRRYRDGFYIAKKKENTDQKNTKTEKKRSNDSQEEILTASTKGVDKPYNLVSGAETDNEVLITSDNSELKNISSKRKPTLPSYQLSVHEKFNPQKRLITQNSNKSASEENSSNEDDVKMVLLIILAVIIPPLAVYLKNEKTDTWFWATLILCLATFSIFFFIFGGLLWVSAVIIALLVVLNML